MGDFRLGKTAVLGKAPVSTGFKLGMGKVPQCMFGVHINEPTGNIMALHDAFRGKEFQPNDAGLDGYPYRAEVAFNPSVGGSEGYQFLAKVYYAKEAAYGGSAGNVNGTEALDGEPEPIPKFYLNELCRWDFGDVRFQLKGVVGASAYTYRLIEKVDGVWALFMFKMNENPDTARTVCCYWGKQTAVDESSDDAAEAIIPDAVLAMPLDEADAKVTPQEVVNNSTAWSIENWGTGSVSGTATLDANDVIDGSPSTLIQATAGSYSGFIAYKNTSLRNWAGAGNKVRVYLKGFNSGLKRQIYLRTKNFGTTDRYRYDYTDNWSGWKWMDIPFSSFVVSEGTPTFDDVKRIDFTIGSYVSGTQLKIGAFTVDVGVPAQDYSGNGNHGATTGTTITASPFFAGKNARQFNGITDKITIPSPASLDITDTMSILVLAKPSTGTGQQGIISVGGYFQNGFSVYVRHVAGFDLGACFNPNGTVAILAPSGTVNYGAKNLLGLIYDGTDCKGVINNSIITNPSSQDATRYFGNINIGYAGGISPPNYLNGIIDSVIIIHGVVTQANIDAIYNSGTFNYPDPRLIEGSIVVRKWASTTLPTVASVSSMQTRKSYGKQELYPSQDNLNFSIDRANRKATLEFYLENTQTEPAGSIAIIDETAPPAWQSITAGTLAEAVVTLDTEHARYGTNAIKVSIAEGEVTGQTGFRIDLGSQQDYSTQDFICVPVWGLNNGGNVYVRIRTDDSNYGEIVTVDNWLGYKQLVIPLKTFPNTVGTLNLASIRYVEVAWNTVGDRYVDRTIVTAGVWAKVEVGVPDKMQQLGSLGVQTFELDNVRIFSWGGASWGTGTIWDTSNWVWRSVSTKTLDGSTLKAIYGEKQDFSSLNSAVLFLKGKHGETKTRRSAHMANQTITYNKAKTRYRIGFAIKMPPADLYASATSGIGQCRLKLEVYYQ
jgi:hypothetical protein